MLEYKHEVYTTIFSLLGPDAAFMGQFEWWRNVGWSCAAWLMCWVSLYLSHCGFPTAYLPWCEVHSLTTGVLRSPGSELMYENTCSTFHWDGHLTSSSPSEMLIVSAILCSSSLSFSRCLSACLRSLVVMGTGSSPSSSCSWSSWASSEPNSPRACGVQQLSDTDPTVLWCQLLN